VKEGWNPPLIHTLGRAARRSSDA